MLSPVQDRVTTPGLPGPPRQGAEGWAPADGAAQASSAKQQH